MVFNKKNVDHRLALIDTKIELYAVRGFMRLSLFFICLFFGFNIFAEQEMLCIEMLSASTKINQKACFYDQLLRTEMIIPQSQTQPTMLVDFRQKIITMIDPNNKSQRTIPAGDFFSKEQKISTDFQQRKKQTEEERRRSRGIRVSEIKPPTSSAADKSKIWYRLGPKNEAILIGLEKLPSPIVTQVLKLATLTRDFQIEFSPLVLMGLPLLNVDFPVYHASGVLQKDALPTLLRLQKSEFSISYKLQPYSAEIFR